METLGFTQDKITGKWSWGHVVNGGRRNRFLMLRKANALWDRDRERLSLLFLFGAGVMLALLPG